MAQAYAAKIDPGDAEENSATFVTANDDQIAVKVPDVGHDLQRMVTDWNGLAVIMHHHRATDSWIFIAIHDVTLGPAGGGTRIKTYATAVDGLRDALRLAEAMTSKWAIINADLGGGKAVLALSRTPNSTERLSLLRSYGKILDDLRGVFSTAGDLGTTAADLAYLARFTQYASGGNQLIEKNIDSGVYTALGVRAAIRSSLAHTFGDRTIRGRSVLVQGLGQVGGSLARLLARDGARVLINDLDARRMTQFREELACAAVPPETLWETDCDVYAPCCVGGTLNDETIAQVSCRIVCGGANNQLASPDAADKLHKKGILYTPDYIANAGGAIALTMFAEGAQYPEVRAKIDVIAVTLASIFRHATELSVSPARVADYEVKKILEQARSRKTPFLVGFQELRLDH